MKTDNFGFKHKTGLLLPISSLPYKYGIGSFGKSAYEFVDFLKQTNQTVWQVLPLNPTSVGDSPYQSPCSNAGNPYFIDLDKLCEEGLLTEEELEKNKHEYSTIDYGWLFETSNSVCYTATHDSDTSRSFLENADIPVLERFTKETKSFRNKLKTDKLIELALSSISNLVIIPIQDYLNLTNDEGRINTPSTKTGNWVWRIDNNYKTTKLVNKIKKLTIKYNRG